MYKTDIQGQQFRRPWGSQRGGGGRGQWNKGRGSWRGSWRGGYKRNYGQSNVPQSQGTQVQPVPSDCPYRGWGNYFPAEPYVRDSRTVRIVQVLEKYLTTSCVDINAVENTGSLMVDFQDFTESIGGEQFIKEFEASPDHYLKCAHLALHHIVSEKLRIDEMGNSPYALTPRSLEIPLQPVFVRFYNVAAPVPLRMLKAKLYGKLISIRGTVVRVSPVRPYVTHLSFKCNTCSMMQVLALQNGRYATPSKCLQTGCRSKLFVVQRDHKDTKSVDRQIIRVQELLCDTEYANSAGKGDLGRIPRSVECELTRDLVDKNVPGDIVTVTGIVNVRSDGETEGYSGPNQDRCLFTLYIQVNSVINERGRTTDLTGDTDCEFSVKELNAIRAIHAEENLFSLLVASLCPGIYGHDNVKMGLLLALFGGVSKYGDEKNRIPIRGDPHVLVVGDPGLGKSQMLQAAAKVSPRGVFVCGNTSTAAGLTVTLTRDSGGQECGLEAGALVLADQGCCCIDEFDKMSGQHAALLEAMEQQNISLAKAGIVCSLPARASIIAAANPRSGHYNRGKTVAENLKMNSALLSRFDLVFIMLDRPDAEMDLRLSEHVMALHAGRSSSLANSSMSESRTSDDFRDLIPHALLRKYVAYARKYVRPKLSIESAAVLQSFYLELRRQHHTKDSTPITTRQLESLIRLSEARAKSEMRETVTEQDAEEVVGLMRASMCDVLANERGFLDFSRSQQGSGMSGRSAAKRLVGLMEVTAERNSSSLFSVSQIQQLVADNHLVLKDNLMDIISSLNYQGYLLKAGPKLYRLQTAGY